MAEDELAWPFRTSAGHGLRAEGIVPHVAAAEQSVGNPNLPVQERQPAVHSHSLLSRGNQAGVSVRK